MARLLLDSGARMDDESDEGGAAFTWAAEEGHWGVVKLLLDRHADVNLRHKRYGVTALIQAARQGNRDALDFLLARGALMQGKDSNGRTALHWACLEGRVDAAKLLLDRGADADDPDEGGDTPLHWAALKGSDEILRLLLGAGASPQIKNRQGDTVRDVAARLGHTTLIEILNSE